MIKFLTKKGLLTLVPFQLASDTYDELPWPVPYAGDITSLITLLRQCPSYQIDKNHTHCGLRAKIVPALNVLEGCIDRYIGVDAKAWKKDKSLATWAKSNPVYESNGDTSDNFSVQNGNGNGVPKRVLRFFEVMTDEIQRKLVHHRYDVKCEPFVRTVFTAERIDWDRDVVHRDWVTPTYAAATLKS